MSQVGIPLSGNSYKKSSISFFVLFSTGLSGSLGPAITAWEPKRLFPIPLLFQIVGKIKGFFVSTSRSVLGVERGLVVLNRFWLIGADGGWGGGGAPPLSIKSSILGKEGGGWLSP